ncbi:MAG TPA: hypothetical protein VL326_15790, partial [Kofleriaceae bacterium]|nr:hypothetical protein [Kofleriaceae bacterium]
MPTRRDLFHLAGGVAAASLIPAAAFAKGAPAPQPAKPMKPGAHEAKALTFDPAKLKGLSAAMLTSHHDNNYAGAVKNLNKVELDLDKIDKDTPGYTVSSLRERELTYTNSVILHEHYFGNLG